MTMKLSEEFVQNLVDHSFKDFHVKGFDYLCLERSPKHTRKVYFFDGEVSQLPEVVNPHDHRYDFKTTVLTGVMSNSTYHEDTLPFLEGGKTYHEFEYRTPLNGGNGFTYKKTTKLFERQRFFYRAWEHYNMRAEEFHTIRMHAPGTVLVLDQYHDRVPVDVPTRTFVSDKKAPNLDGLYKRFTEDQAIERYSQYYELLRNHA